MRPVPAIVCVASLGWLGLAPLGKPFAGVPLPPAPLTSGVSAGARKQLPPTPPPPSPPRVPTLGENLRALLALPPDQREQKLAHRPAKHRDFLQARLAEFDALPPLDREIRLRLLELRSVLVPLLKTPPTERAALLELVPREHRMLVTAQLRSWDTLDVARQQQILASESTWAFLPPIESRRNPAPTLPPAPPSRADHRQQLEERLASWQAMRPEQRDQAVQQLDRFLALNDTKRQQVLAAMPPARRHSLEKLAQAFGRLAPRERQRCLSAFLEVAEMSEESRNQFWQSADRWKAMSPEERSAWRTFTAHLPPQPPDLGASPMPDASGLPLSPQSSLTRAAR